MALLSVLAEIMAEGKIRMRHRDSLNRQNNPVKFWILAGTLFVVGTVASIVGVVKLITDI